MFTEISTFQYQIKAKEKMLSFSHLLIITLLIWFLQSSLISLADSQNAFKATCVGNFEILDGKCVPCQKGFIKQGDKCVSQIFQFGSGNSKNLVQNCQVMDSLSLHCLVCKVGYYKNTNVSEKSFGSCIKNDCQIYFEGLRQCLSSQSKILENFRPEKSFWVDKNSGKDGYNEFKYSKLENLQLSVVNPNQYLMLQLKPDNTFIEKKVEATDFHVRNSVNHYFSHKKQNIIHLVAGCIEYTEDDQCEKCQDGFYLNLFTKQCKQQLLKIGRPENFNECEEFKQISNQSLPYCAKCKSGYYYSYFSQSCERVDPLSRGYQQNGRFEKDQSKNF